MGCYRFVWDEAKYPTVSPLREIVDGIHVQVAKIEDDMKVNWIDNPSSTLFINFHKFCFIKCCYVYYRAMHAQKHSPVVVDNLREWN